MTLRHEDGHDLFVTQPLQAVATPKDLAQAEAKLSLLVLVGDAFDFGDEDGAVGFPGEVKVRLVG